MALHQLEYKTPQKPTRTPLGIRVHESDHHWVVSCRRFNLTFIMLTLWCIIWDADLIIWCFTELGQYGFFSAVIGFASRGIVAVVGTYLVLCAWLNKTLIDLSPDKLIVGHSPLPWFGARAIETGNIHSLETRRAGWFRPGYALRAIMTDGTKVSLLSGYRYSVPAFVGDNLGARLGVRAIN